MYPFRFNIVIYIPLPPFSSPHHLPQIIIKITLWNLVIYNPKLLSLLHTLKSSSGQLMCWWFWSVWNMWIFLCQPCVHNFMWMQWSCTWEIIYVCVDPSIHNYANAFYITCIQLCAKWGIIMAPIFQCWITILF